MRVELRGLREIREKYLDPGIDRPDRSQLQLLMQMAGARIQEVVKVGHVIFTEVLDDTGKSLVGPDTYSEALRTAMRAVEVTRQVLEHGGVRLDARLEPAARQAATIAKMKGTVRVLYAKEAEEITIVNPRELAGSIIVHPRLQELGIEIRVMPPGDPRSVPPRDMFIALQYLAGENHIRGVEFCGAWMRPMLARPRPMKTNNDEDCVVFQVSQGRLDADSQMIIQVYPELEETEIEVEFHDVPLP